MGQGGAGQSWQGPLVMTCCRRKRWRRATSDGKVAWMRGSGERSEGEGRKNEKMKKMRFRDLNLKFIMYQDFVNNFSKLNLMS